MSFFIDATQVRILQLLARGHESKAISGMLLMSDTTVKINLRVARGALGAKSTIQAVSLATARGIISPLED